MDTNTSNSLTLKAIFTAIVKLKKMQLSNWLLFNIVIGTLFIWAGLIVEYFFTTSNWQILLKKNLLDGEILIFSIGLSVSSMSFLWDEVKGEKLADFRKLWLGVNLLIVIVSSITVGRLNNQPVAKETAFIVFSLLLFVILILFALGAYAVRVNYVDYSDEKAKEIAEIEKKAEETSSYQGIKI